MCFGWGVGGGGWGVIFKRLLEKPFQKLVAALLQKKRLLCAQRTQISPPTPHPPPPTPHPASRKFFFIVQCKEDDVAIFSVKK